MRTNGKNRRNQIIGQLRCLHRSSYPNHIGPTDLGGIAVHVCTTLRREPDTGSCNCLANTNRREHGSCPPPPLYGQISTISTPHQMPRDLTLCRIPPHER